MIQIGKIFADRYRIIKEIGRGEWQTFIKEKILSLVIEKLQLKYFVLILKMMTLQSLVFKEKLCDGGTLSSEYRRYF